MAYRVVARGGKDAGSTFGTWAEAATVAAEASIHQPGWRFDVEQVEATVPGHDCSCGASMANSYVHQDDCPRAGRA